MKRILLAAGVMVLLVSSACAPAAPTIDAAQVQASAMAAAGTMIAMTDAAMPTATPTPLPSPTPMPTLEALPTLPLLPTVTPTSAADDCNHLLDLNATTGKRAKLLINNNTNGSVNLSMGYFTKDAFGQCGYIAFSNIPKKSSITVSVPQTGAGPCYSLFAWVNDPKQPKKLGPPGLFCMNNPDKWTMNISYVTITLTPP